MPQITTDLTAGTLTATIANPPHGVMDADTEAELAAVLDRAEGDDAVRVLVLAGGLDGVFIRHYSVEALAGLSDALRAKGRTFDETSPVDDHAMNRLCARIEALPKPVLVALNGTAMGGGWELAMAADIRIAEDGPFDLGLPEVNIGVLPGAGGTQRLARLVGTARALEMILRGRTVRPDEALALGMVHEVAGDARARTAQLAAELAAKPARALAHTKRLVRAALPAVDPETLRLESRLFLDLAVSDEANALMHDYVAGKRDIRGGQ